MKKLFVLISVLISVLILMTSCFSETAQAELQRDREARAARVQSDYAKSIASLEMLEGNFKTYRRVTFYNVRLGETVFCCEGYCHIQIDSDRDVEIVVKTGENEYLRHYLGQRNDITYFSEQLKPANNTGELTYKICWNPKVWVPDFMTRVK